MGNLSSCCSGFLLTILSNWYPQRESLEASPSSAITAGAQTVNDSLFELDKPQGKPTVQLLFFHGLQFADYTNASLLTWESRDGSCIWPQKWLVEEIPGAHVLYVSYDGRVGKTFRGNVMDMNNIAENLRSDLMQAKIGQVPGCPVILVGHSVGGLVMKQVCYDIHDKLNRSDGSERAKLQTFLHNVKGIFFYSTPHHGSPIAEKVVDLFGGPLLDYFKIFSKSTARLNEKFDDLCRMYPNWKIAGVGESKPTRLGLLGEVIIVPEAAARLGDFNVVDEVDHFTICKPMTKMTRSYNKLRDFVRTTVGSIKEQGNLEISDNFQYVPDSVIGINGPKEEIKEMLVNSRKVALVGMGGVGKTTLAKAVFNSMSQQFEYSCFVENSKLILGDQKAFKKEAWKQLCHNGKWDVSAENWSNLRGKKLLLVLDDISADRDGEILSELAEVTGPESRFIITSRNTDLVQYWWHDIYQVPFLTKDSSMELFQSFAFPGQAIPPPEFGGIMETIVEKCDGLPLTLEVLGRYLRTKLNHKHWIETLHALVVAENVADLNKRLWAKLRPSYEGLGAIEQQMFLDATTFFSNSSWTLREAYVAWRAACETTHETACERIRWQTLVDMSLVYQVKDDETIKVHEQLQSLGRKIASEPNYSSKWRVWNGELGYQMLQTGHRLNGKELYALRAGYLDKAYNFDKWNASDNRDREMCINIPINALPKLKGLRFLEVDVPVTLDGAKEDGSFPTELVLLKCVGQNLFDPALQNFLAVLDIDNLEHLPSSIERLSSLEYFRIRDGRKLRSLPESFGKLSSLKYLTIAKSSLRSLPESFGKLSSLENLTITNSTLRSLPKSFGELSSLKYLKIYYAPELGSLPDSFGKLSSLRHLELRHCRSLQDPPISFGQLKALQHFRFMYCPIQSLPDSFGGLCSLNHLEFHHCNNLPALPDSFGQLKALQNLSFEGCPIQSLPNSFGGLSSLRRLALTSCDSLQTLPESFGGLSSLNHLVLTCENLRTLPESFGGLSALNHLVFTSCWNLRTLPDSFGQLKALQHLSFEDCPIQSLPDSFGKLSSLNRLEFSSCKNLRTLPDSFGGLSSLTHLLLRDCARLHTLPKSFWKLSALEELDMDSQWETSPEFVGQLTKLKLLSIGVSAERLPSSLGDLKDLRHLVINRHSAACIPDNIKSLPSLERLDLEFSIDLVDSLPPWLITSHVPSKIGKLSRISFTVQDGCFSVEEKSWEIRSMDYPGDDDSESGR